MEETVKKARWETSVEEVTPREISVEEVTPREISVEEGTSRETSVEEVTLREISVEEVTPREISVEEVTQRETSVEEVTSSETSVEEDTSSETSVEEVTPREISVKKVFSLLQKHRYDKVKELINENRFDVNGAARYGDWDYTVLMWTAEHVQHTEDEIADIMRQLLNHPRCDINHKVTRKAKFRTALQIACKYNNAVAAELLLQHEQCEPADEENKTVHYAASNGLAGYTILKALLQHPRFAIHHSRYDQSPFAILFPHLHEHYAMKSSHETQQILQLMKQKRVEVKFISFFLPVEGYTYQTFCKLLEMGAYPHSQWDTGETTMHSAVRINSYRKCVRLLELGADLQVKWKGMNVLEYAVSIGAKKDILTVIGAKFDLPDRVNCLERYSATGESLFDCATRLGVQSWISDHEQRQLSIRNPLSIQSARQCDKQMNKELSCENDAVQSFAKLTSSISTSLYTKDQAMITTQDHESPLQVVLRCNDHLRPQSAETGEVIKATESLVNAVADDFANSSRFSFLQFEAKLSGSISENTKGYIPNEIDITCYLNHLGKYKVESGERPSIKMYDVNIYSGIKDLCDKYNRLYTSRLSSTFYEQFNRVLKRFISEGKQFGKFSLMQEPLLLRDQISCLQLMWRGECFKDMMVYVDLVPSVKLSEDYPKPKLSLPLGVKCDDYHVIAKTLRSDSQCTWFSLSYSCIEKAILAALPPHVLHGYIFAKAIRIASICRPRNLDSLGVEEPIRSDDYVTSYMLKTALLIIIVQHETEVKEDRSAYEWADRIYEELEKWLSEEKVIPPWYKINEYSPKHYWEFSRQCLIDCRPTGGPTCFHSRNLKGGCCMRRELMLALIKQIRQWLSHNMVQLKASNCFPDPRSETRLLPTDQQPATVAVENIMVNI